MNDLRLEIKEAFEKEQALNPPRPDLRRTVSATVAGQPRPARLQWVAVAAAVLIGALVVAGLLSTRLARQTAVPAQIKASPAPSAGFDRDYGTPPPGVPVFYVGDAGHPGWYTAVDWTGKPRGTLKLPAPPDTEHSLIQAPDGALLGSSAIKLGFQLFVDPVHRTIVAQDPSLAGSTEAWADDSSGLCVLQGRNSAWSLGVAPPGGAPASTSHPVALDSSNLQSGIVAIGFASCSPANDRAVLVYDYFGRPTEEWTVRLSDGAVLRHEAYPAGQLAGIVSSADGSLLAYNSNRSSGYLPAGAAAGTVIRRTADGAVVETLDPSIGILAFSGDGKTALVTTTPWAAGVKTSVGLLDLSTRTVFWKMEGGELAGFLAEPGGGGFALLWKEVGDQDAHPQIGVYLVGTNGRDGFLPGRYLQP